MSARLSLRQIEYLVAVVDLGSLREAATLLHVSQPTISHQLAALERRIGLTLFERVGRGVQPTAAARALARAGQEMLDAATAGLEAAEALAAGARRQVTVGVLASLATRVLPRAIAAWSEEWPDLAVRVREYLRRAELDEAVQSGAVDIGIGVAPAGWDGARRLIGVERYGVVLPPRLRTTVSSHLRLASLARERWVLFDTDHGLHDLVQRACASAGFSPTAAVRTRQVDTAVQLAAAGLGPALVPVISVPSDLAHLVVAPRPAVRSLVEAYGRRPFTPTETEMLDRLEPARTGLEEPSSRDRNRQSVDKVLKKN